MECQHALYEINHYLTCPLLPQQINYFIIREFFQHQGVKHQVERTHQNIKNMAAGTGKSRSETDIPSENS